VFHVREKAHADRRSAEKARHVAAEVGRDIADTASWQQLEAALAAQAGAARIIENGPGFLGRRQHQVGAAEKRYCDLRSQTGRDVEGGLTQDQANQVVAEARRQLVDDQARLEQNAAQSDADADEAERTINALTTNRTAQREEETVRGATLAQRLRVIDDVRGSVPVYQRRQLDSEAIRQRQAGGRRQQHTAPGEGAPIGRDAAEVEL